MRVRPEGEALAGIVDLDPARMIELTLAEHDLAEDQELAHPAIGMDMPLHCRILARGNSVDRDGSLADAVDPKAIAQADLKYRRHGQEAPALAGIDKDTQAARARDVVRVARH